MTWSDSIPIVDSLQRRVIYLESEVSNLKRTVLNLCKELQKPNSSNSVTTSIIDARIEHYIDTSVAPEIRKAIEKVKEQMQEHIDENSRHKSPFDIQILK